MDSADMVKIEKRFKSIKYRFNISKEQYIAECKKRNNKCDICGTKCKTLSEKVERHEKFQIDHDHKTGKIRGLLCHGCNLSLGRIKNFELFINNVKNYLANGEIKIINNLPYPYEGDGCGAANMESEITRKRKRKSAS